MSVDLMTKVCYGLMAGVSTACFFVEVPIHLQIGVFSMCIIYIGSVLSVKLMIKRNILK